MSDTHAPLKERHGIGDFLYWNAMAGVPLLTAGLAIYHFSRGWLTLYIVTAVAMLGLIYRFYCTHCPHYTRKGKTTRCMFFWGMPKFFARRPGPLTGVDKAVTLAASAALFLFPINWLMAQPGLLTIYLLSFGILAATMVRHECHRCVYFDCPANRVPEELKQATE